MHSGKDTAVNFHEWSWSVCGSPTAVVKAGLGDCCAGRKTAVAAMQPGVISSRHLPTVCPSQRGTPISCSPGLPGWRLAMQPRNTQQKRTWRSNPEATQECSGTQQPGLCRSAAAQAACTLGAPRTPPCSPTLLGLIRACLLAHPDPHAHAATSAGEPEALPNRLMAMPLPGRAIE